MCLCVGGGGGEGVKDFGLASFSMYYIALCITNKKWPKKRWNGRSLNCKKWNESGFRPPLCTYRLNWARRTSWGWWDDWDDTVLQTQDPKFGPWRSEAEYANSRSRRLPTILTFVDGEETFFVSVKPPRPGTEPRTLAWRPITAKNAGVYNKPAYIYFSFNVLFYIISRGPAKVRNVRK